MQRSRKAKKLTYFMLALALFVFLFTLHAKVSVYHHSGLGHFSASSKLWLDGEKMEVSASIENSHNIVPGLFVALLFLASIGRISRPADILLASAHFSSDGFEAFRFSRPPPAS